MVRVLGTQGVLLGTLAARQPLAGAEATATVHYRTSEAPELYANKIGNSRYVGRVDGGRTWRRAWCWPSCGRWAEPGNVQEGITSEVRWLNSVCRCVRRGAPRQTRVYGAHTGHSRDAFGPMGFVPLLLELEPPGAVSSNQVVRTYLTSACWQHQDVWRLTRSRAAPQLQRSDPLVPPRSAQTAHCSVPAPAVFTVYGERRGNEAALGSPAVAAAMHRRSLTKVGRLAGRESVCSTAQRLRPCTVSSVAHRPLQARL